MRKRLLLGLTLLPCLALSAATVLWLKAPRHNISRESFERIQVGMTLEEVEAVLGTQPGDYTSGPVLVKSEPPAVDPTAFITIPLEVIQNTVEANNEASPEKLFLWCGDGGVVGVLFDRRGRAQLSSFSEVVVPPSPVLTQLRRWLGW